MRVSIRVDERERERKRERERERERQRDRERERDFLSKHYSRDFLFLLIISRSTLRRQDYHISYPGLNGA